MHRKKSQVCKQHRCPDGGQLLQLKTGSFPSPVSLSCSILYIVLFSSYLNLPYLGHFTLRIKNLHLSATNPVRKSESRTGSTLFHSTYPFHRHTCNLTLIIWLQHLLEVISCKRGAVWFTQFAMGRLFVLQNDPTPCSRFFLCKTTCEQCLNILLFSRLLNLRLSTVVNLSLLSNNSIKKDWYQGTICVPWRQTSQG